MPDKQHKVHWLTRLVFKVFRPKHLLCNARVLKKQDKNMSQYISIEFIRVHVLRMNLCRS